MIKVKQLDDAPVPLEVLADSIVAISEGVKRLRATRIKDDTLYLLIQHAAPTVYSNSSYRKPTIKEIKAVLDGIESLRRVHLKADEKKGK